MPGGGGEEQACGGGDNLLSRGISADEGEVGGGYAVFVWERKAVTRGLFVRGFGGGAGIDEMPGDAAIDEEYALTRQAFAIEGRALLQRMVNVVGDGDVLSKELLAQAFVQAGAFVLQGSGGEIVKKKADEIENGGRFENLRVTFGEEVATA